MATKYAIMTRIIFFIFAKIIIYEETSRCY